MLELKGEEEEFNNTSTFKMVKSQVKKRYDNNHICEVYSFMQFIITLFYNI